MQITDDSSYLPELTGQKFCGVNVIAYYSSVIFKDSGFSVINSLLASLGFGIINFLFGGCCFVNPVKRMLICDNSYSRDIHD